MAIFLDGFEQFDRTEDLPAQMRKAGYSIDGGSLVMGTGQNGRCITTARTTVSIAVPWTSDKMSVGFTAKFTDRGGLFSINGVVFITDAKTGFVRYCGTYGGAIPIKGRWYHYEVEMDRAAGTVELFINGKSQGKAASDVSFSNAQKVILNMNEYNAPKTLEGDPTNTGTDNAVRSFDNLHIADGDRFGPVTITTLFPDHSNRSEWDMHSEKDMSHAEVLGKIPSQELDRYLMTNKDGKVESMTSSTKIPSEYGKVVGIGLVGLVRKTDREDASIVFGVGSRTQDINDLPFIWGYRYAGWRATDQDTKESVEGSEMSLTSNIRSV